MNASYDYVVKDMEAFCKDYADDLYISTEDERVDARRKFWVIRRIDKSIDFPYAICIMENDGTLSEIDYCNQGRIQEWLQKDIIRPSTPEDFVTNKRTIAYLEGLRKINLYIDYTSQVEKAVEQVLEGTNLNEPADIIKFATQSYHHFVYLLSKMVQVKIIPRCE